MDNPNPQTPPGQGAAPAEGQTPPAAAPQSKFEALKAKKGFQTPEDLAASYESLEPELGRTKNVLDKTRKQLESAGYTIDEDGTVKPMGQPQGQPQGQQPYQAGQQPGHPPQADPLYDPINGGAINDPVILQMARSGMNTFQIQAAIANAMIEQRDKFQSQSYQADAEVTAKPEAKGFEDDLRKEMMKKPLAQRADKAIWEQTLYHVKGQRYDTDMKNASSIGVDAFLNKTGNQGLPTTGSTDTTGVRLTPDQENQYRWYAQNRPGQFKDRKQFAEALSPSGGR